MSEEESSSGSILKNNWHLIGLSIALIIAGFLFGFPSDEPEGEDPDMIAALHGRNTDDLGAQPPNPFTVPAPKERNAIQAIGKYEKEIEENGKSLESEKNLYRIGNLYHSTLFDYEKAIFYYQRLVNEYPESNKIEMVYFAIADSYEKLEMYDEEMKTYETIISVFPPESPAHQLAQEKRKGAR